MSSFSFPSSNRPPSPPLTPLPFRFTGPPFSWDDVDWSQYRQPGAGNAGSGAPAGYAVPGGDGRVKAEDLATRVVSAPRTAITGTPLVPAGDPSRFGLGPLFQPTDFLQAGNASASTNSVAGQPSVITNGNAGNSAVSNAGVGGKPMTPSFPPAIPGLGNAVPNPAAPRPAPNAIANGIPNVAHIPGIPDQPSAPAANPPPGARPAPLPFAPTDAPYRAAADGHVDFDPARQAEGVRGAFQQGLLSPERYRALLPLAQAADQAAAEQKTLASKFKAMGYGATKGAAFLAGAPAGAAIGAEIGGVFGPLDVITVPVGAAIGGAVTGGAASLAVDKLLRRFAQCNATVKSFTDAADAHPGWDTAGGIAVSFPRAATTLAGRGLAALAPEGEGFLARTMNNAAREYEAGTGSLPETIANFRRYAADALAKGASPADVTRAIATRIGLAAARNVVADTAFKEGARKLGLSDQGQTLPGAVQAALLGGFTSGHASPAVEDVLDRNAFKKMHGMLEKLSAEDPAGPGAGPTQGPTLTPTGQTVSDAYTLAKIKRWAEAQPSRPAPASAPFLVPPIPGLPSPPAR